MHPISGYAPPELNLEVRKWGRTTGFTEGFIDGIYLATNIDYGDGFIRHFENQFHIAPLHAGGEISRVGDSGALVLTAVNVDELETIASTTAVSSLSGKLWGKLYAAISEKPRSYENLANICIEFLSRKEVQLEIDAHPILSKFSQAKQAHFLETLIARINALQSHGASPMMTSWCQRIFPGSSTS